MTKRILTALLAVLLVAFMVLSLVACDSGKKDKKDKDDDDESFVTEFSDIPAGEVSHGGVSNDEAVSSRPIESSPEESSPEESSFEESDSEESMSPNEDESSSSYIDWEGKEVTFLCRNGGEKSFVTYQVDAEEPNDDPLINAFYRRNTFIKDTYNLDINVAHPESGEDIVEKFRMDMMSGMNTYSGIVHPITYLAPLAADGILKDFNGIDNGYINLDKDYWDQALINDLKIKDKVFFLAGDAIVQDDQATRCMYFNRKVIEEYNLEDPYELVENGEWTIDKDVQMAQQYELTNGAVKSYNPEDGDKWGLVVQSYDLYQFMMGADQRMVDNSGDVPVLRVDDAENIDTFNKVANWFIYDNKNVGVADYHGRWNDNPSPYDKEVQIFANGNALFMPHNLSTAGSTNIRESELEFGILPMPKRSSQQENYASGINAYHFDVIALPHNLHDEDLDAACFALEAMAFYGKELVTPEYYETTICQKRLQDDKSVEMLDIILGNRIFDMGSVLNFNAGNEYEGTLYFYTDLLGEHSDAISSHYEARKSVFQAGIDLLVAQCEANL